MLSMKGNMARFSKVLCLSLITLLVFSLACASLKNGTKADTKTANIAGKVIFESKDVFSTNASQADTLELMSIITNSWNYYLHQDLVGYTNFLAPDITRLSKRAGQLEQGKEVVAMAMAKEWEAFERPNGVIAEEMTIQRAEFKVDKNPSATVATAIYWINVIGGARWKYNDQGLVFQAFAKINGAWKITHQTDSWSLDYNIKKQKAGQETFEFDYAYPVTNLSQAINFYSPILGKPEGTTKNRAYFNLKGAHFILDSTGLEGFAKAEKGLPNGYAIFYVNDVVAERNRLKNLGTKFIAGTDTTIKKSGTDLYAIGLDPSENVFVIMQRNFVLSNDIEIKEPSGFIDSDPYLLATKELATAWIKMDTKTIANFYDSNSRWFDNTRTKIRGMEKGQTAIISALSSVYWPKYDRTASGLVVKMNVSSLKVRKLAEGAIVSYQMELIGTGSHPFRDVAFVTHLFDSTSHINNTFIVENNSTQAMAIEFDYTGYPVTDLAQAENFYTTTMNLGRPYTDSQYRGYWSNNSVFGIYTSRINRDALPRANQSNGYISFWVYSAQETYKYLQAHGSSFPLIPAINSTTGIDVQPGYIQVLATDSEGSAVIFTEYTGKRK